jgi:hypothetical protein
MTMTDSRRTQYPMSEDQRWFHHPEMQARIARAEADFRQGRCTVSDSPEEAQQFLDSLKS